MPESPKKKVLVFEVKKSAGKITVKAGTKKSLADRVDSFVKGT
jgi:hypothetical protein